VLCREFPSGKSGAFKRHNTVKFAEAYAVALEDITDEVVPLTSTEAHQFGFAVKMDIVRLKIFAPTAESRDIWIKEINQTRTHALKLTSKGKKKKKEKEPVARKDSKRK